MKRKIISCILLFCMLVTLNVLLFCVDKKTYKYELNGLNNSISVMVFDDEEQDYIRQSSIPTGNYSLNEMLSYCEGNGSINGYDNSLGKVITKLKGSDKCYFYFDKLILVEKNISASSHEETLTIPISGTVKIEVWGAQGYTTNANATNYGAYAVGEIELTAGTKLYINVGSQATNTNGDGGYNGGGKGSGTGYSQVGYGGGGATSVALSSGTLYELGQNNKQSDVIIVAAGGGSTGQSQGSQGGGIEGKSGYDSYTSSFGGYAASGATQSSPGDGNSEKVGTNQRGYFGKGGSWATASGGTFGGHGGGGGWYGGGGTNRNHGGGGGGSSYIAYETLTNKKMVCYTGCTTNTNESTYTISNSCAEETPTENCSKKGDGHIKITYYSNNAVEDYESTLTYGQETYEIPVTGTYKLEVWGAQGGSSDQTNYPGGYGAYATGEIELSAGTTLYINIGGQGSQCASGQCTGGYNGGGNGYTGNQTGTGGGGATSIALSTGTLAQLAANNKQSDIIIVAAGGGGVGSAGGGSHGGGIQGSNGTCPGNSNYTGLYGGTGATQSSGGTKQNGGLCGSSGLTYTGSFGQGGASADSYCGGSGGGGGYYGGGGSLRGHNGAGGGSSYIGYDTLNNKKMVCYTGCTTNSTPATLTESKSCVNSDATSECSKMGNGYAKITFIEATSSSNNVLNYLNSNNPAGWRGSSHTDSATQNLYRFTGSYQSSDSAYAGNVNNYICLGSDASSCPADNMYRIIGVVASDDVATGLGRGMIKVIKNTNIGIYTWEGGTTTTDANANVNSSNYSSWRNGLTSSNNDPTSGRFPLWKNTYLNSTILNQTFLNNLSFKNKIASVKWHCYVGGTTPTAATEYASNLCDTSSTKIGLMYSGDYLNSYNNGTTLASTSNVSWLQPCTTQTSVGSGNNYKYNCCQWTNASFGYRYDSSSRYGWSAWNINYIGEFNNFHYFYYDNGSLYTNGYAVRPVFYLNNNISIISGSGTYASPFRIN